MINDYLINERFIDAFPGDLSRDVALNTNYWISDSGEKTRGFNATLLGDILPWLSTGIDICRGLWCGRVAGGPLSNALGFKLDQIRRLITIGETSINSKIAQAV